MELNLESLWQDYGFGELQEGLNSLFPEYNISLENTMERILSGDIIGAIGDVFLSGAEGMLQQMAGIKNILIWLLLLGIASSILTHFVEIFNKHQIAALSYYFMYLLFVTILFQCFVQTAETAKQVISNILMFVQLMIPTYLIAVGVATGTTTVSAYSQLLTLIIYGVEQILDKGVMKLISVYIMLSMVNGIWIEERMALLADLVKKIISLILKAALGVVTGISIFQTLITPVIDSAKSTVLQKALSSIPGIGNMGEGVMELVIGSAVVIKNSIGVVLLILLLLICAAPLLKIFAIAWILRLAAAMLGMISDKRLVDCTNRMGEGCMMMFRTAATAMVLFLIIISLVAAATNRGF